ncbi:hypothetical protein [Methanoculleus sp.]|uniref:hypothetical protein n=1 Tax=Methanoculleus sp. TaxID=90427 RepID=UPI0025E547F6|nr:hypothetical protein [Methanoculleus sp.]MCK9319362.1 hypothetical protein [Methanoculleus sp.]
MSNLPHSENVGDLVEDSINIMEAFIREIELRVDELKRLIEFFTKIYKLDEEIQKKFEKALSLL